jgi:transmembrane sensor
MSKDAQDGESVRNRRRKARAEAAAWVVRLHGPYRTPDLEAGCRAWLAESAENAAEFERVTDVWDAAASRSAAGIPRVARWDSAPRRRWSIAATLIIAVGTAGILAAKFWSYPSYATEVGEQRIVHLDDGTRITLNSDTKVTIAFTEPRRQVRLDRGEAFFEVAHNRNRPFIVAVGNRQVTALGTAFAVSYDPNRTAVTLVEGKVSVARGETPDTGTVFLSPGERVTYSRKSAPKLDEPKLDAVTAWRRGEVVLDKTPLADAVTEMNRYETTHLIIQDPRTAALRVSGIYHAGDSAGFARTVAELYGLELSHEGAEIRLRAK